MLNNKKGLSTVVTTLIIILLVLVAIGIIWVVVRGVIEQGSGQIKASTQCNQVDVRITNVPSSTCDGTSCVVTVERRAGGGVIGGIYLTISDGTNTRFWYQAGDIPQLTTSSITSSNSTANPTIVRATAYINNENNLPQLCPSSAEYNLLP